MKHPSSTVPSSDLFASSRSPSRRSPSPVLSFSGAYAFLSNFHPSPIRGRSGIVYPTAEHAYQAMKSRNPEDWAFVSKIATPGQAKRYGSRVLALRPRWEAMKIRIMARVVRAKFRQNSSLLSLLLATAPSELVEGNTWGDTFWGQCRGKGTNHLGLLLMEVRDRAAVGRL